MEVKDWQAVRQMIERYQTESFYSPVPETDLKLFNLGFGKHPSDIAREVLSHLENYVNSRNLVAASPEARLMRISPWLPLVGLVVVVLGNFKYGMEGYLLSMAFVTIAPGASFHYRFKEQFKTMRHETELALWKALRQEHQVAEAVESNDRNTPASIDYFKGQLHDIFTSPQSNKEQLDLLESRLVDSDSREKLKSALNSFINAREIVAYRARTSLAPCLGGTVLFGALALAAQYAGHSGPSYFGRASFACGVGAIGTGLYMAYSSPIQSARQAMKENLDKAMAYMPAPQGA